MRSRHQKQTGRNSWRTCLFLFICFFSALLSECLAVSLRALRSAARDSQRWMWTRNPFRLFASFLCCWATRKFGASWSVAFINNSSLCCRIPWRRPSLQRSSLVNTKREQSLESSIWPHIGTRSGGGIKSVSAHASSIELTFALPRSR